MHSARPFRILAAAAAAIVLSSSAALAQPGQTGDRELRPPTPPVPIKAPSYPIQVGVAIVLLVLVCVASTIPSKRGHQD